MMQREIEMVISSNFDERSKQHMIADIEKKYEKQARKARKQGGKNAKLPDLRSKTTTKKQKRGVRHDDDTEREILYQD